MHHGTVATYRKQEVERLRFIERFFFFFYFPPLPPPLSAPPNSCPFSGSQLTRTSLSLLCCKHVGGGSDHGGEIGGER